MEIGTKSSYHIGENTSYAYQDWLLREVTRADETAKGDKKLLLQILEKRGFNEVVKNPSMLYADYWNTLKDLGK